MVAVGDAFAHGGAYQPPPPRPIPGGSVPPGVPFGPGPTTGGGTGPGPTTGGGGGPGPTTGGGDTLGGPTTGGPGKGGPTTGGPGPTTGGGAGPGPTTGGPITIPPRRRGSGLDPTHWSRWWYANRVSLIEWSVRAAEQARDVTPSIRVHTDPMFKAEARAALVEALSDRDEDIASGAAIALGKDGDPTSAPILVTVLQDRKRQQPVREAAALALGLLRPDEGPAARDARRALASIVTGKAPERLRASAVYALGLRRESASVPLLLDLAGRKSATWDVPGAAVASLGIGGADLVLPDLIEYVVPDRRRARDDTVRRSYAAQALALAGATEALPALRDAARDKRESVRRASIHALGALAAPDDDQTFEVLVRALKRDGDGGVRHAAALALGRSGHRRAAPALDLAFRKGDGRLVPYAALGLGLLARHDGHEQVARPVARALAERNNARLRGPFAIACGLAGEQSAAKTLRSIVEKRGDTAMRAHAALALGLLGDATAVPALRTVVTDELDPELRRETALALGMLGDTRTTALLRELVEDGDSVYVSGSAAVALGRIGGVRSGRSLLGLLQDDDRPTIARAMAAVGLGLMLDETDGRRLAGVGTDLDPQMFTPTVHEILTIL